MSSPKHRWILAVEVAAVALFLGLMATALATPPPVAGPAGTVQWEDMAGEDTRWLGIYLGEAKIGYSSGRTIPTPAGATSVERTFLRLGSMGEEREVHTYGTYETDHDHRALRFSFEMQTGDMVFRASGEGKTVSYSIGGGEEETLVFPEAPLMASSHPRILAGASPGDVVDLPYLDPATMTRDTITYQVGAVEPVPGMEGISGKVVNYSLQGADVKVWLDQEGSSLREEGLLGMVTLREPREVALTRGWSLGGPPDLVALSAVPVDRPIPGARTSRVLVVKLHGPESLGPMLEVAHGERWDGTQVGVHVPDVSRLASYDLPATDPSFEPYLSAETLLEVDDPAILEAVNGVLSDMTDAEAAARRLNDWVFAEIEKTPVVSPPSALHVLQTRKGDCNEHTALYTAMARAAGLPTRVAAGIVYTEALFSKGSFYYHAWPEVWLGEWVPVDPTFGQFPADATHIKFVNGGLDHQVELIGVIGALSAEVVEVR